MSNPKDPRLEDLDSFEEELEGATLLRLRGEDPRDQEWQPEEADLIRYVRGRHALAPELRARIGTYLETHPAERDALAVFETLAPEAPAAATAGSSLSRLRERLSVVLASFGGAQSALAAAASITLVVGVGLFLTPEEEPVWRGEAPPIEGPEVPHVQHPSGAEAVAEIELLPGIAIPVDSASLPAEGELLLTLALPGELPAAGVAIRLIREGAAEPLVQQAAAPGASAQLRVPVSAIEPGRYRVEVVEPGVEGLPLEFPLEVR